MQIQHICNITQTIRTEGESMISKLRNYWSLTRIMFVVPQTDQRLQCYVSRLEVHGLSVSGWNKASEMYVFFD